LVLAAIALIVTLIRRPRVGVGAAVAALLIPALGLGYMLHVRSQSSALPPIHDVATNAEDPPVFSPALMREREASGANPVNSLTAPLGSIEAYKGPRFADRHARSVGDLGREAFPDLRPVTVNAPPTACSRCFGRRRRIAAGPSSPTTRRAACSSDGADLLVRLQGRCRRSRPSGRRAGQLQVDARSTSRVGLGDMGANAARPARLSRRRHRRPWRRLIRRPGYRAGEAVKEAVAAGRLEIGLAAAARAMRGIPRRRVLPAARAVVVAHLRAALAIAGPIAAGLVFIARKGRFRRLRTGQDVVHVRRIARPLTTLPRSSSECSLLSRLPGL
jgi:fatty-acyl-CoA synthase